MKRSPKQKKFTNVLARPNAMFSIEPEFMTPSASPLPKRDSISTLRSVQALTSKLSRSSPNFKSLNSEDKKPLLAEEELSTRELSDDSRNKKQFAMSKTCDRLQLTSTVSTSTTRSEYKTVYDIDSFDSKNRETCKLKIDFSKILSPKVAEKSTRSSRSQETRSSTLKSPVILKPTLDSLGPSLMDIHRPSKSYQATLVDTNQITVSNNTLTHSKKHASLPDLKFPSSTCALQNWNIVKKPTNPSADILLEEGPCADDSALPMSAAIERRESKINVSSRFIGTVSDDPSKIFDRASPRAALDADLNKVDNDFNNVLNLKSQYNSSTNASHQTTHRPGRLSTDFEDVQNTEMSNWKNRNLGRLTDLKYILPNKSPDKSKPTESSYDRLNELRKLSLDKSRSNYISGIVTPDLHTGSKKNTYSGDYGKSHGLSYRHWSNSFEIDEEASVCHVPFSLPSSPPPSIHLQYSSSSDGSSQTSGSSSTSHSEHSAYRSKSDSTQEKLLYDNSNEMAGTLSNRPQLRSEPPSLTLSNTMRQSWPEISSRSLPNKMSTLPLKLSPETSPTSSPKVVSASTLEISPFPVIKSNYISASLANDVLITYKEKGSKFLRYSQSDKKDSGDFPMPNADSSLEFVKPMNRAQVSTVVTQEENHTRNVYEKSQIANIPTKTDDTLSLFSRKSLTLPTERGQQRIKQKAPSLNRLNLTKSFFEQTISREDQSHSKQVDMALQLPSKYIFTDGLDPRSRSRWSSGSSLNTNGNNATRPNNPFCAMDDELSNQTNDSFSTRGELPYPKGTSTPNGTLKRKFGGLGLSHAWSNQSSVQYAESSNCVEKDSEIASHPFDMVQLKSLNQIDTNCESYNPFFNSFDEQNCLKENSLHNDPLRISPTTNRLGSLSNAGNDQESGTTDLVCPLDMWEEHCPQQSDLNCSDATEKNIPSDESLDLNLSRPLPPPPKLVSTTSRSQSALSFSEEELMHDSERGSQRPSTSEPLLMFEDAVSNIAKDIPKVTEESNEQSIIEEKATLNPSTVNVESFPTHIVKSEIAQTDVLQKKNKKVKRVKSHQKFRITTRPRARFRSKPIVIQYIYQSPAVATTDSPSVFEVDTESSIVQASILRSFVSAKNVSQMTVTVPIDQADGQFEAATPGIISSRTNLEELNTSRIRNESEPQNDQKTENLNEEKSTYIDRNENVSLDSTNDYRQVESQQQSELEISAEVEKQFDNQTCDVSSSPDSSYVSERGDESNRSTSSIDFDYTAKQRSLDTIPEYSEDESSERRLSVASGGNSLSEETFVFADTITEEDIDFRVHRVLHEHFTNTFSGDYLNEFENTDVKAEHEQLDSNLSVRIESFPASQPPVALEDNSSETNSQEGRFTLANVTHSQSVSEQSVNKVSSILNFEKQDLIDISEKQSASQLSNKTQISAIDIIDLIDTVEQQESIVESRDTNIDKKNVTSDHQLDAAGNTVSVTPNSGDNSIVFERCNIKTQAAENIRIMSVDHVNLPNTEAERFGTEATETVSEKNNNNNNETTIDGVRQIVRTSDVIQERVNRFLTNSKITYLTQDQQDTGVRAKTLPLPPLDLISRRYSEGDVSSSELSTSNSKSSRRNSFSLASTKVSEDVFLESSKKDCKTSINVAKNSTDKRSGKKQKIIKRPAVAPPKPPTQVRSIRLRRAPPPPSRSSHWSVQSSCKKSLAERFTETQEASRVGAITASYLTDKSLFSEVKFPQRNALLLHQRAAPLSLQSYNIGENTVETEPKRPSAPFINVQFKSPPPLDVMAIQKMPKVPLDLETSANYSTLSDQTRIERTDNEDKSMTVSIPTRPNRDQLTPSEHAERIFGRNMSFSLEEDTLNLQSRKIEEQQANLSAEARLIERQIYEARKDSGIRAEIPHLILDQENGKYLLTNEVSLELIPKSLTEDLYKILNMKNQLAEKDKQLKFLQRYNELQREQLEIEERLRYIHGNSAASVDNNNNNNDEKALLDKLMSVVQQRDKLVKVMHEEHERIKLLGDYLPSSDDASEALVGALRQANGVFPKLRKKKQKGVKNFIKKKYKRVFT